MIKILTKEKAMAILIAISLYVIIGGCIPFLKQPKPSKKTINKIKDINFYGDKYTGERVQLLSENSDALEYRIRMIAQAKEKIELSTFQFYADGVGKAVISSLIDAANRGVKVRIIVDGIVKLTRFADNKYFLALAKTENVEMKIYNPISLLRPWSINGRLHDKYLIVDDSIYTIGGRNISGIFLGDKDEYKKYDWDVLVYSTKKKLGQSMRQVLDYFDIVWNSKYNKTIDKKLGFFNRRRLKNVYKKLKLLYLSLKENCADWFKSIDYYTNTVPVKNIQLLANPISPYAKEPVVFYAISRLMKSAEKEVKFHTPFIISNDWMRKELSEICRNVPNVTVMTNSVANNCNRIGSLDYMKTKGKILDTGVNVLEYDYGVSYHGKCFVIDDRLSSVGSFNWDMRSAYIDTETMIVIDSEEFNDVFRQALRIYEEKALKVVDKNTSIAPKGREPQKITLPYRIQMMFVSILRLFFRFLF